jgi:hypothetical protein
MRKNTTLTLLAFVFVVGLVALCWLALCAQASGPIALGLQSYTNSSTVVGITNRSSDQLSYVVMVERKIGGEWPKGLKPGTIIPEHQFGSLCPGQFTNLTLPVMVYTPPYPWRVTVFSRRPSIQLNSLRFKIGLLARRFGMRKLTRELWGANSRQIQASTKEMQQWER